MEVQSAKDELGLTNRSQPPKMDLFSISKVVELMLQYVMIQRLFNKKPFGEDKAFVGHTATARESTERSLDFSKITDHNLMNSLQNSVDKSRRSFR